MHGARASCRVANFKGTFKYNYETYLRIYLHISTYIYIYQVYLRFWPQGNA